MGFIFSILLFVLLIGLFFLLAILGFLRSIFRFGRNNKQSQQAKNETFSQQANQKSKVFEKTEGEYVDYEEVKD